MAYEKYKKPEPERPKGERPQLRIVQPETDKDGKAILANVGGIWKNKDKSGKEYLTAKIGNMRMVCFSNAGKSSKEGKTLPAYGICVHDKNEKDENTLKSVGALWENKDKNGKVYHTMTIGELRLLVFENTQKDS
jgi:uncharacterized protein (DUF736 family)